MPFTSGQYGPDTFLDSAGNTRLIGATVTASGYVCTVDAFGNLTVTGPAADAVTLTVVEADGDTYQQVVRVEPSVAALAEVQEAADAALTPATASATFGPAYVPLVLFIGESNSGGRGLNTDLAASELLARQGVLIWNNTSSVFEALDIGTNNLLGHTALTAQATTEHGWEAGLANSAEAGEWQKQVYLLKAGQGGSKLDEWNDGGTYWTTFVSRFTAAASAIRALGFEPQVYVWASIGINDHIAGTTTALYKSRLVDWIARIRGIVGTAPVMLTRLPLARDTYNVVIDEVDAADPFLWAVRTDAADLQADGNHWTSAGQKRIASAMVDRSLRTVGQGSVYVTSQRVFGELPDQWTPLAWENITNATATTDGKITSNGAANAGATAGSIDATKDFEFELIWNESNVTTGGVFMLDDEPSVTGTWPAATFVSSVHHINGTLFFATTGANATSTGATITFPTGTPPAYIRIRRKGNDLIYSKSEDAGLTFADYFTHSGVLSGKTTLYPKWIAALAQATNVKAVKRVA